MKSIIEKGLPHANGICNQTKATAQKAKKSIGSLLLGREPLSRQLAATPSVNGIPVANGWLKSFSRRR
ncbi:MAG: hypothetical protein ACRCRW_04675 [Aeromonadaceae bacterium]